MEGSLASPRPGLPQDSQRTGPVIPRCGGKGPAAAALGLGGTSKNADPPVIELIFQTLPGRLELPTLRLTASHSNQLSYGSHGNLWTQLKLIGACDAWSMCCQRPLICGACRSQPAAAPLLANYLSALKQWEVPMPGKNTHRGARAHDHKVKGLALYRLS